MTTGISRPAGDMPGEFNQSLSVDVTEHSLPVTQEAEQRTLYHASWVDRLMEWVDRLPLPPWGSYLGLGLGMALGYFLLLLGSVAWESGFLDLNGVLLYSLLNGMTAPYLLALVHYLDKSAVAAISRFRPVMSVDDAGYHKLRYQLTNMPARTALLATALGTIYSFASLWYNIVTLEGEDPAAISPLVLILDIGYDLIIYVFVTILVYHTLHQLRMVNTIYTKYTRINIFQLGPLYALSGLTARTAIGIGIPTYIWFQAGTMSARGTSLSDVIQTVFLGVIIVVTFISPLLGAHGLLEREKQRLKDEVARRIESTIAAMHSRVDSGEGSIAPLKEVLDGLVTEQGVIDKLRTWPWRAETVSGLGLTFLIPVLIWVVQRVLERFGI